MSLHAHAERLSKKQRGRIVNEHDRPLQKLCNHERDLIRTLKNPESVVALHRTCFDDSSADLAAATNSPSMRDEQ